MKPLTLITAASLCLAAASAHANVVFTERGSTGFFASYDTATGGITFFRPSSLLGIRLESDSGSLLAGATDLDGAAAGILGVVYEAELPQFIEWGNLAGLEFDTSFAGNVVTPGTPSRDLIIDLAYTVPIIEVLQFLPEPGTAALTACGILGLASTRARRSRPASFSC